MIALPPCVGPTCEVRGEYYHPTCKVSRTQTVHVILQKDCVISMLKTIVYPFWHGHIISVRLSMI